MIGLGQCITFFSSSVLCSLFVCCSLFVRVRYMCVYVCAVCVTFLSFLLYCYGHNIMTDKMMTMIRRWHGHLGCLLFLRINRTAFIRSFVHSFLTILTTTVCDSLTDPAKLASVGLGAGRSVCVLESNCSLDVGSWIETARISVAPSRIDAWSQFPTISSYSSISISGSSLIPAISTCHGNVLLVLWLNCLKSRASSARFINWEYYHSDSFVGNTDIWISPLSARIEERLQDEFPNRDISPYSSRTLGEIAGSLISGRNQKVCARCVE